MLYCYTCGYGNEDGAKFCYSCGRATQAAGATVAPTQPTYPQQPDTPPLVIVAVVVGVVGLVLAIFGGVIGLLWPFLCTIAGFVICFAAIRQNQNRIRPLITAGLVMNVVAFWVAILLAVVFAFSGDTGPGQASSGGGTNTQSAAGDSGRSGSSGGSGSGDSGRTESRATSFQGTGYFVVGTEIVPGTYFTRGAASHDNNGLCEYARLRTPGATTQDFQEVLERNVAGIGQGNITVTIQASDGAFYSYNCFPWIPQR